MLNHIQFVKQRNEANNLWKYVSKHHTIFMLGAEDPTIWKGSCQDA
jgi:hypothetical protein